MCGIFGWNFSRLRPGHERLVLALATQNESRGNHGWGWAGYDADGALQIMKDTGSFCDNVNFSMLSEKVMTICHTRYSTHGSRIQENCHPFWHDHIIGAHNGIISNCGWLESNQKYPERKHYQVDSMHIFQHLADGCDLNELNGYAAVEWFDTRFAWEKRRVNLLLFNHNDLAVAMVPDCGTVWSSSSLHLRRAIKLAGWADAFLFEDNTQGVIYHAQTDNLYTTKTKVHTGSRIIGPSDSHGHHTGGGWGPHGRQTTYTRGDYSKRSTSGTEALGYRGESKASVVETVARSNGASVDDPYDAKTDLVYVCKTCGLYYDYFDEELGICWICGMIMDDFAMEWLANNAPSTNYDMVEEFRESAHQVNGWLNAASVLTEANRTQAYEATADAVLQQLVEEEEALLQAPDTSRKSKKRMKRFVEHVKAKRTRYRNARYLPGMEPTISEVLS